MKILHVLTDSNIGGAGILLENALLCSALPHACFTVVLPRGASLAPRLTARGFRVLSVLRGADRSLSLRDFFRLVVLLRQQKPDILHTHASLTARLAGWLAGVPVRLATRHCAYPVGRGGSPLARYLHRRADAHLSTCTVATAQAAADNLAALGIPRERILLIRNGARAVAPLPERLREEQRRALGIGQTAFVIGICARLSAVKDHATLLRALRRLLTRGADCHLLIVGGGEEEGALRRLADRLGIAARVCFVGQVDDPCPYLNLFDVAVNCSVGTETSCLALSEAMSLGIPCVVSRYGGNPELVREGENGLLFPPRDDAALAACLARLLDRGTLYARLQDGARERYCRDLRAETMARAYDWLYISLFEAGRTRGELLQPPNAVWQRFRV